MDTRRIFGHWFIETHERKKNFFDEKSDVIPIWMFLQVKKKNGVERSTPGSSDCQWARLSVVAHLAKSKRIEPKNSKRWHRYESRRLEGAIHPGV